jgi:hypothetical protein
LGLALVRDMRELRAPPDEDEVAASRLTRSGFVLARAAMVHMHAFLREEPTRPRA